MKAVRIHAFGGPSVLQVDEIDVPSPADDEVLIRVHAASINPVDYKIRAGGYPPVKAQQLPKILGRDIAGTIERCGRAVTRWKEGDPVYAMLDGGGAGGYAEYVCLKGELCAPKPAHLNFAEAYVAKPNAIELTEIGRLIDEDRVHPHIHAVYPLEEAAEAQRTLETGHVRGKVVLKLVL
jgi:NADPH:quinone reductase-like Zn-dependent oxidoreductase